MTGTSLVQRVSDGIGRGVDRYDRRGEREFLPAALEVLETPPSPLGRTLGYVIIAFFAVALGWAVLGRVDILATAPGRVLPTGDVKLIQPLDPGVVRAIDVRDGAYVKPGQVLVEFDPTQAGADRDRLAHDLMQARLEVVRLTALKDGHPDRIADVSGAAASDMEEARAAAHAQAAEQSAKLADIGQQISQKGAEAAEEGAEMDKLKGSIPLLDEKERIHRELTRQGFGTSLAYLDARQQASEARHQTGVLAQRKLQAGAARAALTQQRAAAAAEYRANILSDLAKAQEKQNELEKEFVKADEKTSQTELRAPISGVVEQLAIHTVGGVVTPAERLMIIVPEDHDLTIEAQLANRDVGFVHPGQPVQIKVETFNFTRYGLLKGRVIDVSRYTLAPADDHASDPHAQDAGAAGEHTAAGSPSYLARIALLRDSLVIDGRREAVQPGMAVTAEIKTGRRTVLDFLLSPLARRAEESLHER